jgi:hypothetical protein
VSGREAAKQQLFTAEDAKDTRRYAMASVQLICLRALCMTFASSAFKAFLSSKPAARLSSHCLTASLVKPFSSGA